MGVKKNYESLLKKISSEIGLPKGKWVIYAIIESYGIREEDVPVDYGFNSLLELSICIDNDIKKRLKVTPQNSTRPSRGIGLTVNSYLKTFIVVFKGYASGLLHLFPIFLQVLTIILFNYSLWTYLNFNIVQSTAVVLGVIFGFIVSGGMVQVIGRQAYVYWEYGNYKNLRKAFWYYLKSQTKLVVFSAFVLGLVNSLFHFFPLVFYLIVVVYAVLVSILLTTIAPFHSLRKRWIISFNIFFSTVVALILFKYTSLHIYLTHWLGITLCILTNILLINGFIKTKEKRKANESDTQTFDAVYITYKNVRFFIYGTMLYLFIFIDRLLAWSLGPSGQSPLIFVYEKDYEIGMDLSILMFFSLAGIMEYAISSFTKKLDKKQEEYHLDKIANFNRYFIKLYWKHILLLFCTALCSAYLIWAIIHKPWGYMANFGEEVGTLSIYVCTIGSIGYFLLGWGMLNGLYLFTLNVPKPVLVALSWSTAINLISGFLISRQFGYEHSVLGMFLGSFVFMMMTTSSVIRYLRKMDYHYYAAF